MSIGTALLKRRDNPVRSRHPNELDLLRVERAVEQRERYRYVTPTVLGVEDGYLIRSQCCSRNVDPDGGEIDVALINWEDRRREWVLYRRDHVAACWIEDSRYARLPELFLRLNSDPHKLFWQ